MVGLQLGLNSLEASFLGPVRVSEPRLFAVSTEQGRGDLAWKLCHEASKLIKAETVLWMSLFMIVMEKEH